MIDPHGLDRDGERAGCRPWTIKCAGLPSIVLFVMKTEQDCENQNRVTNRLHCSTNQVLLTAIHLRELRMGCFVAYLDLDWLAGLGWLTQDACKTLK